MKYRTLLFAILCTLLVGVSAQTSDYKSEIERITNKRFISSKDFPLIDSLLSVVKQNEGVKSDNFSRLAVIRINKTIGKQKSELHPLYDDFLTIALQQDIPFDVLKRALSSIVSEYRNDDSRWFIAMNTAWQAELNHASLQDTIDSKALKSLLTSLTLKKQYSRADSVISSYIDFVSKTYGKNNEIMNEALSIRSKNYNGWMLNSHDIEKADIFHKRTQNGYQLLNTLKLTIGENSCKYQDALTNFASELLDADSNNIGLSDDETIRSKQSGVSILQQWIDLKSDTLNIAYGTNKYALYDLFSNLYWVKQDTLNSQKYATLYNEKFKMRFGEESQEYFEALDKTRMYFNNEDEASILDTQIALAERLFGKDDYRYQQLTKTKSTVLSLKGNYGGAINTYDPEEYQKSLNKFNSEMLAQNDSVLNDLMRNGASEEMLNTLKSLQVSVSNSTPKIDRNFARLNSLYGNFHDARKFYRQAILEDIQGNDPLSALNMYSDIMGCMSDYRKYNQTDSLCAFTDWLLDLTQDSPSLQSNILQAMVYTEPSSGSISFVESQLNKYTSLKDGGIYSTLLYCLGEAHARIGNYVKALELGEQAVQLSQDIKASLKHSLYVELVYLLQQDFRKAREANITSQNLITTHFAEKGLYLEFLSLIYRNAYESLNLEDYKGATFAIDSYYELIPNVSQMRNLINEDQMWSAGSVFNIMNYMGMIESSAKPLLAEIRFKSGNSDEARNIIKPYLDDLYSTMHSSITMYVTQNKLSELKNLAAQTQEEFSKWASRFNDEDINNMAYNVLLTTKQLTLITADNIRRIIVEDGNESLRQKWDNLSSLERLISENLAQGLPVNEYIAQKTALQTQLAIDANVIGNIKRNLGVDWQSIQNTLSNDDCVVEFSSFKTPCGENRYTATILTKNQSPKAIALFDESEISLDNMLLSLTHFDKIWRPILNNVPDIKNIYFSPAGALHLVGIEYVPVSNSVNMNNKYNLYRLSSSRQLVTHTRIHLKDAAIFGGINYDKKHQNSSNEIQESSKDMRGLLDAFGDDTRSGVSYLPGTKIEADTIGHMLSKQIPVHLYIGEEGTEKKIKEFSQNSPTVLHIATHGFYWTQKEARRNASLGFLAITNTDGVSQDERDMTRSGILMSGANNTLQARLVNAENDGILTAKEVSSIDLSNTDLVVLSACQSALGEVSGEGVFGLQRGFKMAGVNTLLMTLWKVDDRATQILMTKFYEYLLSGRTKLESLTLAQKFVREYEEDTNISEDTDMTASQRRKSQRLGIEVEKSHTATTKVKPFADPKYWAAFVLLDALN